MNAADSLERLTACLRRLPGVGQRSAERMALKLVRNREGLLRELRTALDAAAATVRVCSRCGSVTSAAEEPCRLCTSPARDGTQLCVVEEPGDISLIESSGEYHGRYHALMGRLSPMKGEGLEDLRVTELLRRVKEEGIGEVVLALSTDVEGDATASFLADVLTERGVAVSRLAYGLPAGSGVSYSDPVTLGRAIRGRMSME